MDDFNLQNFYDEAKKAEEFFSSDVKFRHHKSALRDFLNWMDRSGVPKDAQVQSPGTKAAFQAATSGNEKEMEGRIKIVDDRPKIDQTARPVDEQPRSFEDAATAAHEQFMSAVTGDKK